MMEKQLNVATRTGRLAMAQAVLALAVPGWTASLVDRERKPDAHKILDKRRVDVTFKGPRGLTLTVSLDGGSKQQRDDCFVLSWHSVQSPHKLDAGFAGSVNRFHWHKATDVVTFSQMLDTLPKRFADAVSGAAFKESE